VERIARAVVRSIFGQATFVTITDDHDTHAEELAERAIDKRTDLVELGGLNFGVTNQRRQVGCVDQENAIRWRDIVGVQSLLGGAQFANI